MVVLLLAGCWCLAGLFVGAVAISGIEGTDSRHAVPGFALAATAIFGLVGAIGWAAALPKLTRVGLGVTAAAVGVLMVT